MELATVSRVGGYCILDGGEGVAAKLYSLESLECIDDSQFRFEISCLSDWKVMEAPNAERLLLDAQYSYTIEKCVSLLRLSLLIKTLGTRLPLLKEAECLLGKPGSVDSVLSHLLIAPYKDGVKIDALAKIALENGYVVVGSLLHRLHDMQPLLSRFSDAWLSVPAIETSKLGATKEELWVDFSESKLILRLLEAPDAKKIKGIFGEIAFERTSTSDRIGLAHLAAVLSDLLFGAERVGVLVEQLRQAEPDSKRQGRLESSEHSAGGRDRAVAEVNSIVKLLARGKDHQAQKYLDQLVDRQISYDSETHAIKSLCNIAKQCAAMFRTDFESACLNRAWNIDPSDAWTIFQLSDHFKRKGEYEQARNLIAEIADDENSEVARSLLADIEAQRGNRPEAIRLYKEIDGWEDKPTIRMAIADNLRRLGLFPEAQREYLLLEEQGLSVDRAKSGRAQILLREGRIQEAIQIYQELLAKDLNDNAWIVYSTIYASLLKQEGRVDEAVVVLENILYKFPFLMKVRVLRCTLYALRDDVPRALKQLPIVIDADYTAFGEWISEYTRGLLLLKTRKYADAKSTLMKNYRQSVMDEEEREIVRLAAALSNLVTEDFDSVNELLNQERVAVKNHYVEYLRLVLEYHSSVAAKMNEKAARQYKLLLVDKADNVVLWKAVEAISNADFETAVKFEVESMLRMAA